MQAIVSEVSLVPIGVNSPCAVTAFLCPHRDSLSLLRIFWCRDQVTKSGI